MSVPEARQEHAAWVYEGGMFVFGGKSSDDEYLSDLWRLEPWTWQGGDSDAIPETQFLKPRQTVRPSDRQAEVCLCPSFLYESCAPILCRLPTLLDPTAWTRASERGSIPRG